MSGGLERGRKRIDRYSRTSFHPASSVIKGDCFLDGQNSGEENRAKRRLQRLDEEGKNEGASAGWG